MQRFVSGFLSVVSVARKRVRFATGTIFAMRNFTMIDTPVLKIKQPNAPCKNCSDRVVGCHAKCEKYIAWKNNYQEINTRLFNETQKGLKAELFEKESRTKLKKKYD